MSFFSDNFSVLRPPARRRMACLTVTSVAFVLFAGGFDFMLPLWVTGDLQLSAADFAHLRSLRFVGVSVGVIVMGVLSDRFGQRRVGVWSLVALAALVLPLGWAGVEYLYVAMPLLGAAVSTVFVNLNTLVQQVSSRRQGLANSIYRGSGAGAMVVVPLLAASLAAAIGGYSGVMPWLTVAALSAAVALWLHPEAEEAPPYQGVRQEVGRVVRSFLSPLRERRLMGFWIVALLWGNAMAAVGAFGAIRLTRVLGMTDVEFGQAMTAGGMVVFAVTLATGFLMDRLSLRWLHVVLGLLSAGCSVAMGLTDSIALTVSAMIVTGLCGTVLVGPSSMWISREAGRASQSSVFFVHKIVSAVVFSSAMFLLAYLEPLLDMKPLLLWSGVLAAAFALAFLALPEPSKPRL
ncbi:MAG: MFS transporter [Phycisphaerae bacterium]|nr:MFS transporter [Phycisphaerae bacterium]